MKQTLLLVTSCCLGLIIGCGNTAEGLKKDNEAARQGVASGASNLADGVSNKTEELGVAAMLTPKIKLAITGDKTLNADGNLINVNTTAEKVSLQGYVTSEVMKSLASEITTRVLKENDARQMVDNQLVVETK